MGSNYNKVPRPAVVFAEGRRCAGRRPPGDVRRPVAHRRRLTDRPSADGGAERGRPGPSDVGYLPAMTVHVARSLAAFGRRHRRRRRRCAVVASAPPTEPPTGSTSGSLPDAPRSARCSTIRWRSGSRLRAGTSAAMEATLAELTEVAAAAVAAAPEEIAAEVATLGRDRRSIVTALDGVDLERLRRGRAPSSSRRRPRRLPRPIRSSWPGRRTTADTSSPIAVRRRSRAGRVRGRSTQRRRRRRPASTSTSPTSTAAPTSACLASGPSRAPTATGR